MSRLIPRLRHLRNYRHATAWLRQYAAEYFKLDDLNGAVAGTTLTNNNVAIFDTGLVGNGVHLASASSQYLSAVASDALRTGDIPFVVAAWVYLASKPANTMTPVAFWRAGTTRAIWRTLWLNTTDRFRFQVADATGVTSAVAEATTFGAPALATWYLLAGFHDPHANLIGVSVNGGPWDTAPTTFSLGTGEADSEFTIGCDFTAAGVATRFWDGRIDEVGIWKDRILTPRELQYLTNCGRGRTYPF
jgi:hypothetical protein